ncbi:tetratricopeptide repeat protein [Nitrosovibrio sp. Nv17]|jgi:predicted negative regulator of RcsB-dependent stress response|uniref:YfgM family protein n=1 Tax=Nitrosovibrio sp. Nv17 TaxID=1855339 RepID=UPI00090892CB|nr:tetratricopeptide repeat protein [Nitrosovibrio sp. Nv17]SFW27035.1 Putative negative regulator of RcsB-dependent stress response [Nitrosovibrio sp. Nv17]
MAIYDLEEQEKIDGLKSWWEANGTLVIIFVATLIATTAGYRIWKHYTAQQTEQAAELYASLLQVDADGDPKKTGDAAHLLMEGYPASGYAARAALISARASFEAGDRQTAKGRLQWILDNVKEEELKDLARLRLAGILLDEERYDDALRLLDTGHGPSFDGLYADLKGDILVSAGKPAEAVAAYRAALGRLEQDGVYHGIVQMKLDALAEGG